MNLKLLFDRLSVNRLQVCRFKVFDGEEELAAFSSLDGCLMFLYEQYFRFDCRFESFKIIDSETNLVFWPNETLDTTRRINVLNKIFS